MGWILGAALGWATPAHAQVGSGAGVRLGQPNAARFPEVVLYAYPTDNRGLLMGGLRSESFRVTENGRPAQILQVESEGGTLDVCLAIDCSPSMLVQNKLDYARLAARDFLQQLAPDDRAALVSFSDRSTLEQPLTSQRQALSQAVDRTATRGETTAFLDSLYWAISQVSLRETRGGSVLAAGPARPDARRVVLALTDGNDNGSRISASQVIGYARSQGVALCTFALGEDAATAGLEHLAQETGGVYLRAPGPADLQHLYVALARQLRREYRIRFKTPVPTADATRRNVTVKLSATPLAGETWYQAPGQGSLLVTVPSRVDAPPVSGTAGGAPGLDPRIIGGVLLVIVGLGVGAIALFVWIGQRGRHLPIRDSNPRLDLLPLWVKEGCTRVGRGEECDLVLDSGQVSRVHARIEAGAGTYLLIDEGSSNGTYVNGRRVKRRRELCVGDTLRFGDREFRFAGKLSSG